MANICDFTMTVCGKKENIIKLHNAITQAREECWIGRGADCSIEWQKDYEGDKARAILEGWTKWSLQSSLIDNAISMEQQRLNGGVGPWYWDSEIKNVKSFLTIFEFCEKYDLEMEAWSEETGIGFREHLKYSKEFGIINECEDFYPEEEE